MQEVALTSDIRGLKINPETGDIWLALADQSICRYSQQHGLSTIVKGKQGNRWYYRAHFEFFPESVVAGGVVVCGTEPPGAHQIRSGSMNQLPITRAQDSRMLTWAIRTQSGRLLAGSIDLYNSDSSSIGFVDSSWTYTLALDRHKFLSASARDDNSCFLLAGTNGYEVGRRTKSGPYIFTPAKQTFTPIEVDGTWYDPSSWDELKCSIFGVPDIRALVPETTTRHSFIITHASHPLVFHDSNSGRWYRHPSITGASIGDYDYETNTLAYANPSHPNKLFIAEAFFNPTLFYSTPRIDIPLLQHSFSDIPTDATFTHAASNTTFHLHSFVLPPSSDTATTLGILKSITVPLQIVQNYIAVLYRNETHDPAKIETNPWSESAAQSLANTALLTHLLHLTKCNAFSGPYEESLKEKLDTVEVGEVLLNVFLPVWPHCYENPRLMDLFACTLRRDSTSLFRNAKAIEAAASGESFPFLLQFSVNVGDRQHQISPAKPAERQEFITNVAVDEGQLLEWTSNPLAPPAASEPFSFVFGIDGVEGHVVVRNGWILYSSWSWFRRVLNSKLNSKLNEFKTRTIMMPSSMSPALLVTLLRKFHGIPEHRLRKLPVSDHIAMLALSDELELVELFPIELDFCRTSFKCSLHPSSCIKMLRQCWELEQQRLVDAALDYIASNWAQVAVQSRAHLDLPLPLAGILNKKLANTA